MIAGSQKGKDFRGLFHYLFWGKGDQKVMRGYLFGGTVLASHPEDLVHFYEGLQRLRPDVSNPVHHVHVSLPPGETLTPLQWLDVAGDLARALRWGHYSVIGHEDTACEHIHIVGTRLSEGRVFSEQLRDVRIIMRCLRRLEHRYHLRRVESPKAPRNPHGRVPRPKRETCREKKMNRAGKTPRKELLRQAIDRVIHEGFRQGEALIEIARLGYDPFTVWRNGAPIGISFTDVATGRRFAGARLGTEYAGIRFFERIGGIHGHDNRGGSTFRPDRIAPYDFTRGWRRSLRAAGIFHRPLV